MPLSIFAMMGSVMTLQRRCVVASPGLPLPTAGRGAFSFPDLSAEVKGEDMTRSPLLSIVPIIFSMAAALADDVPRAKVLFQWCTSKDRSIGDLSCTLYIGGFVNGLMVAGGKDSDAVMCLPDGFTGDEARAVFIRKMRLMGKDSSLWDASVDLALTASLASAFPCAKKSN
jgi:Rap1a immunity proteins